MKLCAISVDLDEIPNYFQIHGLPLPAEGDRAVHAVYDLGLPRLAAFADAHGTPLTLFAIGSDLARAEAAAALRALSDRGHAVENHSLSHRYDLTRLEPEAMWLEVEEGARAIERAVGRRPTGFRAPGYTVNDALFDVLEEVGVAFDSSVFPCPPYYGAKAAVMGGMRLFGRRSASMLDTPRVLTAPRSPYRPGRPWFRAGARPFVELPIQVTRGLRLPFIGTYVGLAGTKGAAWMARQCSGAPLVNLELHGIDFLDALDAEDGLAALAPHQRELRVPVARRLGALGAALSTLAADGYRFVRLDEAAAAFG